LSNNIVGRRKGGRVEKIGATEVERKGGLELPKARGGRVAKMPGSFGHGTLRVTSPVARWG